MLRKTPAFALFVAFLLFAALFPTGASAQTGILPDQFGTWQADGAAKPLHLQDLGANGENASTGDKVLLECGMTRIEQRVYRNGNDESTFRVFVLRDPTSAYEFYTFLLAPGMQSGGLGENSVAGPNDVRFLVGNLVVQATLPANTKPESLSGILPALKSKADPTPLPPLRTYLPEQWRVFGSDKYALGPQGFRAAMASLGQGAYADLDSEVGFQDEAETILARYQGQHGSGILLLIIYPNVQLAENHLHHLRQALPDSAKQAGVTVERKASLLSIVFAPTSAMHAQAIRDEVNYETEVTWNEPSQTATEPPMLYMIARIFVFTTLFCVVATITGIAFGGIRVLIKHWLPGKIFDRPEDIEVLQLGLTSKKIDPTDLY